MFKRPLYSDDSADIVDTFLSEHGRRATKRCISEQHPEGIVVLDAQCTVCPLWVDNYRLHV